MRKGDIEGRVDPFYYIPEIVELEKKVRRISTQRLRSFIISISSGATPSVREEEKFYSDAENGVPFIRVQNLSHTNELILNDLKYINHETHQKYLNRSQIREGDLLVKITGVGRMAVSSIVPSNFEGNINQHLVAIKTKDSFTSEVLATFLNTDIAEKLASRRATGGTRPALDYTALKSMPIVFKPEIVGIVKKAVVAKRQKEAEADALLSSIDGYLLQALGITLPQASEKKAFFYTYSSKVYGRRFDPFYHQIEFEKLEESLINGKYSVKKLEQLINSIASGSTPKSGGDDYTNMENGVPFIRVTNLKNNTIEFDNVLYIKREIHEKTLKRTQLKQGDVLLSMAGTIGLSIVVPNILEANINQAIAKIEVNTSIDNFYLSEFLNSFFGKKQTQKLSRPAVQTNISLEEIKQIKIPLPPLEKQAEIVNHISHIRAQAKQLQLQAEAELETAKQQVESMILGEYSNPLNYLSQEVHYVT